MGGVRLSKPTLYRAIGEEEGLGDRREGEVRILSDDGEMSVDWGPNDSTSLTLGREVAERMDSVTAEKIRERMASELDDPELELKPTGPGQWKIIQNLKISDEGINSPFLFCLAREPVTGPDWRRLRDALPKRYNTWTVTENICRLKFEIECGIKRWMGLNEITEHRLERSKGFISYSYNQIPPNGNLADVLQIRRWFQKRTKYRDQSEFRLAWLLSSPQWKKMPESIDIELTRTGLSLFEPWVPPNRQ